MANESAIILPVEAMDPVVRSLRSRYDPVAALGVPPHITLLYPFRPPQAAIDEIEALSKLFASIEIFEFSFVEVRRFPKTAYLHPDKPQEFLRIIRTIMERWPDCLPYKGAVTELIPHLTVADRVEADVLDEVDRSLASRLPMPCVAREAWLLFSDSVGHWYREASFPFAKAPFRD
jgi:2'-5' RNA ligase